LCGYLRHTMAQCGHRAKREQKPWKAPSLSFLGSLCAFREAVAEPASCILACAQSGRYLLLLLPCQFPFEFTRINIFLYGVYLSHGKNTCVELHIVTAYLQKGKRKKAHGHRERIYVVLPRDAGTVSPLIRRYRFPLLKPG